MGKIKITITKDNMEAYVSIEENKEEKESKDDNINFTYEEIYGEITNLGIKYGIIKDNIEKYVNTKNFSMEILVAKGKEPINDEDEKVKINFTIDEESKKLKEDKNGRIDFKSIGSVDSVTKGEVIAELIPSKEGEDGSDIFGAILPRKKGKKVTLKANTGCEIVENKSVVATCSGKPSIKNNTFYVFQSHVVNHDVDLSTGNVSFVGDITIDGNVGDGMKVVSGNNLDINKSVERASIYARGNIKIKGNVISSSIKAGGEDIDKINEIREYTNLLDEFETLIPTIEEIKKFNLLGYDTPDGHIVKVLIENKFKKIPGICNNIIKLVSDKNDKEDDEIVLSDLIKNRLIGLGPISIKFYNELFNIVDLCKNRIENVKKNLAIAVNIDVGYCQESQLESSGDIYINGKGVYISNLNAKNNIIFKDKNSIVRGGSLIAENEIRCATVGTRSGVNTRIKVLNEGHIYADVAYENTTFVVGHKEYTLDTACKTIHAYLDENKELTVEKFIL